MQLRDAAPVAFLGTADPARARAFYENVLGLGPCSDEPHALVFDLAGTTLRIAKLQTLVPQTHTVLGWVVDDLAATLEDLVARGVTALRYVGVTQDHRGIWRAPGGALIAWFADPDGNTLSLTELPT